MGKKSNTDEFIKKAIKIHEDKYNYSKVNYINSKSKIIIICKEHGDFEQCPGDHLKGRGCPDCGKLSQKNKVCSNLNEFIEKSIKLHGNKYDYSKVNYINAKKKIIIICKFHGDFIQRASSHLSGNGCSECVVLLKTGNKIDFITKSNEIHKNKYNYSKVKYIGCDEKVIIICKEHGKFLQSPYKHSNGQGCKKCGSINMTEKRSSNTEEFIIKAIKIHGDVFNYSKVKYVCNRDKVIIICKDHGDFKQIPNSHLSGQGCPKCTKHHSKGQIKWLELLSKLYSINIQHAMNDGEFKIPTTRYLADGYCKETNTIYEFHGDYWHGNPKIFNPYELNKTVGKTHKELYENTLKKEQEIKELGYNLKVMWESDWNKINKSIKKIQKKIKTCKDLNLLV